MAQSPVMGILEVELHQARGLHNICIYQKQDVYATLSILHEGVQTTTYRTTVVNQGGKEPVFNQKFRTRPVPSDSVLRCEVWMDSKAKDYLQDQPLGLLSVPVSSLAGKKKQCTDYSLSSTELFHSPAGTLSMTVEFIPQDGFASELAEEHGSSTTSDPSACSEGDGFSTPLRNGHFVDLSDAREVRQLVSEYIESGESKRHNLTGDAILTGPPYLEVDSEAEEGTTTTTTITRIEVGKQQQVVLEEEGTATIRVEVEKQVDVQVVHEEVEEASIVEPELDEVSVKRSKPLELAVSTTTSLLESSVSNSVTPSSRLELQRSFSQEELGKVSLPEPIPEPRIMQEEIVGMYMQSMQQFSEALAKMQLPAVDDTLVVQKPADETEDIISPSGQPQELKKSSSSTSNNSGSEGGRSQQQSKVFYGSRAFF